MLKNQSVATIAAPEFINIEPYNPLISQCEIKVLYVGENRNGSYITEWIDNIYIHRNQVKNEKDYGVRPENIIDGFRKIK